MITRKELEARETQILAAYACRAAESLGRQHKEEEHAYRTAFQRDRDRVVHSTAFRRLQYKTQVFVNHEGDYYRTRLTHTMEAAQISRTLARALGANEDLAEAIALTHDLGHAPFGHAGQDVLDDLMTQVLPQEVPQRFEHNRQALRIVDHLENRYPGHRGLNLSHELREAIAIHSRSSGGSSAATVSGIQLCPYASLEAQLVDHADAIAYDHHDLDDGLKSGLITAEQLMEVPRFTDALSVVQVEHAQLPLDKACLVTVRVLIDEAVSDLLQETHARLCAEKPDSPDAVRNASRSLVAFREATVSGRRQLKDFLHQELYGHPRVRRMQEKAKGFLASMFRAYVDTPALLPRAFQAHAKTHGLKQVVTDYLAGMTDRYAQDQYRKLFLPFERV